MPSDAAIEIIDIDCTDDEGPEIKPNVSTIQAAHDCRKEPPDSNHVMPNMKAEIDEMLSNFMDLHSKLANREQLMDSIQKLRWMNILMAVKQTCTNEPDAISNNQEEEDDEEEEEEEEDTHTTRARGTGQPDVHYKSLRQEPLYVERLWSEPPTRQRTYKRKKKSYKRRAPKKAAPTRKKAASTAAPSFQKAKQVATRMHNQIVRAKNLIKKTKPKPVTVKKESRKSGVHIKSER